MWPDIETDIDFLGYSTHVDFIYSIISNPKMLPTSIGVFGDWGSGKSSIMRMLKKRIDIENSDIVCLYFNGWLFEGYEDAKSALISSILIELMNHQRLGEKIKEKASKLLKSVDLMKLAKNSFQFVLLPFFINYLSTQGYDIQQLTSTIMPFLSPILNQETESNKDQNNAEKRFPEMVRDFREDFCELIKKCEIKTLLVLIDDLDRCSPERIIDNLEAIKLFLNVDKTAFIIGADPRIVSYAISHKYQYISNEYKNINTDSLVIDYLEKLIQIPYHLPKLSSTEIESYINLLFCNKYLSKEIFEKVINLFYKHRSNNVYDVFGIGAIYSGIGEKEITDNLKSNLFLSNNISALITEGLKGNPRQVKRFLNSFILRKQMAEVAKLKSIKDDVLAKLMLLEYISLKIFIDLYNMQVIEDGFPKQIKDAEEMIKKEKIDLSRINTEWKSESFIKWLKTEPKLSEIDLRDYFWLSRDKLGSTLSGMNLISPEIRELFDAILLKNPIIRNSNLDRIKALGDAKTQLFSLIKQYIIKKPTDENGWDLLVYLLNNDISEAFNTFFEIVGLQVINEAPAAFGINLCTLNKQNPNKYQNLETVLESLSEKNSKIGKAIKTSLKK